MRSRHLSIRLEPDAFDRLDAESRQARTTVSELARTLIDEGLRMQRHPEIVFRPGPAGRRPALIDGPDIWEVARVFTRVAGDESGRAEQTAEATGLQPHQVIAGMRYYLEFSGDIDTWIAQLDEEAERAEGDWLRTRQLLRR